MGLKRGVSMIHKSANPSVPQGPESEEQMDRLRRWVYGMDPEVQHPKPTSVPPESAVPRRFDELDVARGFAICLMIVSHGVKGLMTFEAMPPWGLVPIHLVTKFSSSLFILIFGMTLAISFVPFVGTARWPEKRKKLLVRGLVVFFWYKALTILEMSHLYGREEIWSALLYESFPIYVEILGFYAIALLWVPWVLPFWKSSPGPIRLLIPGALLGLSVLISREFDFFGSEVIQALLVEHPNHYTWGQFARAPLIFVGLLIGWMMQWSSGGKWPRLIPFSALVGISCLLFGIFFFIAREEIYQSLVLIALNAGKHPPEMQFMLFSLAGAFLILGLVMAGGKELCSRLGFIQTIGKNSLHAFVFHIVVLFVFYRFLFDYFHKVDYEFALFLSFLLVFLTYIWLKIYNWVRAYA